jgi:hypothetical protein
MPQVVKYNTSIELNALRRGDFYISVGDVAKSTDWFMGWDAPPGGYTVYQNKASQGPSINVISDNAGLTALASQLSGSSIASSTGAVGWFLSQTDKMVINSQFPKIVTNGLVHLVDFSSTLSYQQGGTTTYYNMGTTGTGVATNGPTFSSSGYYSTDGTDDSLITTNPSYMATGSFTGGAPITFIALFKVNAFPLRTSQPTNNSSVFMKNSYNPSYGLSIGWSGAGATGQAHTLAQLTAGRRSVVTTSSVSTSYGSIVPGLWYHAAFTSSILSTTYTHRIYINGALSNSTTDTNASFPLATDNTGNLVGLGSSPLGGNGMAWAGSAARFMAYNKELTAAEVYQNYYGGPIVTAGLSAAFDAGNLVSYESGSTVTYSMTGGWSGSLLNGVGYTSVYGGAWTFDGSNDSIDLTGNGISLASANNWTVSAWVRPSAGYNVSGIGAGAILSNTASGPVVHNFSVQSGKIAYVYYGATGGAGSGQSWKTFVGTVHINTGEWYHLSWVNSANTINLYVNGVPAGSTGSTASTSFVNRIGRAWTTNTPFLGSIAHLTVQGTALTQSEVLQNFNALRYRFYV